MNKKQILITLIVFLISCFVLVIGRNPTSIYAKIIGINQTAKTPKQLYRVYLSGESLGIINSKKELEELIDHKQQELKNKYKIDKVYAPNDLKIVKETSYTDKLSTVEEIYNKIEKIKGKSSFTIDGYKIKIKGIEEKNEDGTIKEAKDIEIYVLDKKLFEHSVTKTITAFIDKDVYEKYLNGTQEVLGENEAGSYIDNLYIQNNISITKCRVPAEGNIYTEEEELSKFLLFGTTKAQEEYTVKLGDTIEDIANNNKLSIEEFLIANTGFKSASDLLFPGQKVNLGLITPQFNLVEEKTVVSKKTIEKKTVYKDDPTQYVGKEKVEEEGSDGLALVNEYQKLVNGEIKDLVQTSTTTLVPAVDKVITRGTKKYQTSWTNGGVEIEVPVGVGSWVWPTNTPYTISSTYGWRWGKLHEGLDITGTGYKSPIKAANNGIVVESGYLQLNGNYILIKHSNNYYTMYAHLAYRNKQVGDVVMANDVIGGMGMTGFATGVHLHFAIYNGYPYRGGHSVNPYTFYRR